MGRHGVEVRRPDRRRLAVWESYLRSHAALMRVLERDLQAAHRMSLAEYDVLVHLHAVSAQRLRMGELAQAVLFSTGGLSRLLDRMEKRNLITRERQSHDRRVVKTYVTPEGLELLKALDRPVAALHKRQFQNIAPAKLKVLTAILEEVRIRNVGPGVDCDLSAAPVSKAKQQIAK